jgi:CHAT domain-containing protein
VKRVELGSPSEIDKLVPKWLEQLRVFGERNNAGLPWEADRLRELVWKPIADALPEKIETIYICPDGALSMLPWPALPGRKAGSYLLEDYRLATLPYPLWLLDQSQPERETPNQRAGGLLLVGGVDYFHCPEDAPAAKPAAEFLPAEKVQGPMRGKTDQPAGFLHGTADEVKKIKQFAEQQNLAREVTLLTGTKASEGQVTKHLPQVRWAHISTHGLPPFAGDRRSPLVTTGLELAGSRLPRENLLTAPLGRFTGESIAGLDLRGLELLVLSACQSGRGEVHTGEGTYGLQRAFHLAGAQHVVASLWNIPDQATNALMQEFYQNLWGEQKLPPLDALRAAQLTMLRRYDPATMTLRPAGEHSQSTSACQPTSNATLLLGCFLTERETITHRTQVKIAGLINAMFGRAFKLNVIKVA